jgi:thymidylate kinase
MAAEEPDRWVTIDATDDMESVQAAIRAPILRALAARGLVRRDLAGLDSAAA